MEAATDAELMSKACNGDDDAFRAIVDRHKDGLVRYLTHLTRDFERAEELAQETFVKLYLTLPKYREEGKLAPFLFRIATNRFRAELAKAKRWQLLYELFGKTKQMSRSPQEEVLSAEATERVAAAIDALPVHFKAAVILRDVEGWSYDEIAEALGCNSGTVKSRIARGRDQLKETLRPYWIGDRSEQRRTLG